MRPVIGVLPLWRAEKEQLWMRPDYLEGIMEAGGAPLIFPFTEDEELAAQLTQMCDGILFTGGQDVSPSIYGEESLPQLEEVSEGATTISASSSPIPKRPRSCSESR